MKSGGGNLALVANKITAAKLPPILFSSSIQQGVYRIEYQRLCNPTSGAGGFTLELLVADF